MDRIEAFTEYARILKDAEDWLDGGYRGVEDDLDIQPPPPNTAAPKAESLTGFADSPAGNVSAEQESPAIELDPNEPVPAGVAGAPSAGSNSVGIIEGAEAGESLRTDPAVAESVQKPVEGESPRSPGPELLAIAEEIRTCRNCNLNLIRSNTVPGIGSPGVRLMVITPPPANGALETMSPLPPYEQEYLEKWLRALKLNPQRDVFVTPAVKCRTPGARPPHPEEAAACSGYLRRQYKAVEPKAVLALGAAACGALTGSASDFPALVGRDWTWGAVPALVLWTPAEVLANPNRLRKPVWNALQRLEAAWNAIPGTGL